jgi:NitT/TauT family transport system substrate-binding protein
MRVMKARENDPNAPLVCFCEVAARDPFFLVGRIGLSEFSLTDLPRLRLATVSEVPTPWLCLQQDLRESGIDPDCLQRVTNRTMADNLAALRNREIDVAQMFEPYVSIALEAEIGKILYAASARGPAVYTTFLATRDGIARNRVAFVAMVRAVRRTQSWLEQHDGEDLAAVVAPFYPNVARRHLVSALQRYRDAGLWARRAEVSREGFARLSASLLSGGFVTRTHAYEDCVDQSLY